MKAAAFSFAALMMLQACSGAQKAPGYDASGASSLSSASEMVAPAKEFEQLTPAAEDEEGLFLNDTPAATTTTPATTTTTPATTTTTPATTSAGLPAKINAVGGNGYYQNTSQGYQYYNAQGKATSYFGQPGANGQWAITQGTYNATDKTYGFANNPTLLMKQDTASKNWTGTWQDYNYDTKKYTPLANTQNYDYRVIYNSQTAKGGNPWATTILDKNSEQTGIRFNSWLPTGTPTYFQGGKQVQSPFGNFKPIETKGFVPNQDALKSFFGNADPFATAS